MSLSQKKNYKSPALIAYGSIAELTQGGAASNFDGITIPGSELTPARPYSQEPAHSEESWRD